MNDLDIRKQVHQAVDDMTKTAKEDPWLAQRILAQEKGEQPMARKISASMVIAIVLIIISLSAALAAGLGIFDSLSRGGDPDERLPVLETVAQPVGTSQTTEEGVTLDISQAYYEGNRVFISYRITGPRTHIELHEGAPEKEYDWFAVDEDFVMADNYGSDDPEQQRMIQFLDGSGQKWAAVKQTILSDGITLEDGTYADIIGGDDQVQADGSVIGWKECEIPDDHLEDTLTFKLTLRHSSTVNFQDGTTLKCASDKEGSDTEVRFTLNRNDRCTFLKGSTQREDYTASGTFACGQVDIRGSLVMTCPEEWAAAYDDWEWNGVTDTIWDWHVYRGDTLVTENAVQCVSGEGSTEVEFELLIPKMDDTSGLKLVPVYRKTGAHPDEAIPLVPVT